MIDSHTLREVSLLDVTLRDGGFTIDFDWPARLPREALGYLAKSGIDKVEVGYIGGIPEAHGVRCGAHANLTPQTLGELHSSCDEAIDLVAMVHPGAYRGPCNFTSFRSAGLSWIRFVFHPSWEDSLGQLVSDAKDAGLFICINIALASTYHLTELINLCKNVSALEPDVIYIADTCSAMLPSEVATVIRAARQTTSCRIGFHAHDFLSLAFANSIAAVEEGATFVDASLTGLGRGAGNLRTELWAAYCTARMGAGYDLAAISAACKSVAKVVSRDDPDLVHMLCGALNLTPPEETEIRRLCTKYALSVARAATLLVNLKPQPDIRRSAAALLAEKLERDAP